MHPVSGGTQKVTFNQQDREYESQRRAAVAQAAGNPYVNGIGTETRQADAPGNVPEEIPGGQPDPQGFISDEVDQRLKSMIAGGQNQGLNNRPETFGV